MEGKTLFLKFNTGPSGHGMPPAGGRGGGAQARRRRGGQGLRRRGRGRPDARRHPRDAGTRPGASASTTSSSCSTGTTSASTTRDLVGRARHARTTGSSRYGWRVAGTEQGSEWAPVTRAVLEAARGDNPDERAVHGLVQDAQGPRLRQVRQQDPRHAARHERDPSSGRCARSSRRSTASSSRASDEPAPDGRGRARRAGAAQLRGRR